MRQQSLCFRGPWSRLCQPSHIGAGAALQHDASLQNGSADISLLLYCCSKGHCKGRRGKAHGNMGHIRGRACATVSSSLSACNVEQPVLLRVNTTGSAAAASASTTPEVPTWSQRGHSLPPTHVLCKRLLPALCSTEMFACRPDDQRCQTEQVSNTAISCDFAANRLIPQCCS